MNYLLHVLIYFNIYLVVAISLNIVVGYCGLITLAHATYFAIGCYTYAIVATRTGLNFVPTAVLSTALGAFLSLLISLPSWRLKGDFFVMVTLAVQALAFSVFNNWVSPDSRPGTWQNLTNGPFGIAGIPAPSILGIQFGTIGGVFVLSSFVAAICLLIAWLLLYSPWGRVLQSVRDDELAGRGLGKNVRLLRLQALAIACAMAAVAGCVYASYVSYVDPSVGSLDASILYLCMALVGGLGNLRGPVTGAAILIALPEILRFAHFPDTVAAELRLMAYGLLLLAIMHFRPQGVLGIYRVE